MVGAFCTRILYMHMYIGVELCEEASQCGARTWRYATLKPCACGRCILFAVEGSDLTHGACPLKGLVAEIVASRHLREPLAKDFDEHILLGMGFRLALDAILPRHILPGRAKGDIVRA